MSPIVKEDSVNQGLIYWDSLHPACNLALMVGTTDIPDWCYVEACGSSGKNIFTEAPPADYLTFFHSKSPISHLSKVCLMVA